jgi:hypothetical protein
VELAEESGHRWFMPSEPSQTSLIPLIQLIHRPDIGPRTTIDQERIELFTQLLMSGEDLPPIEVVPYRYGKYLIADGIHRAYAAQGAGRNDIAAYVIGPPDGESPTAWAYRRALETATRSALPLTMAERRRAVIRLAEDTEMSHRAIGRLVGVSHDSVRRWINASESTSERPASMPPTPDQVANQLAGFVARLDDARGLRDLMIPQRMGRHLAGAFQHRFGDHALKEAERVHSWMALTVEALRTDLEGAE